MPAFNHDVKEITAVFPGRILLQSITDNGECRLGVIHWETIPSTIASQGNKCIYLVSGIESTRISKLSNECCEVPTTQSRWVSYPMPTFAHGVKRRPLEVLPVGRGPPTQLAHNFLDGLPANGLNAAMYCEAICQSEFLYYPHPTPIFPAKEPPNCPPLAITQWASWEFGRSVARMNFRKTAHCKITATAFRT